MEFLAIGEVAARSAMAPSALRYYEELGLIESTRAPGGARRYARSVLRRLAVIRAGRNVGLSLPEIAAALDTLPPGRPPTAADWARLSEGWRDRLDAQIAALSQLRDGLSSCIGCGCLSVEKCALSNPSDVAAGEGPGARWLHPALRRPGSPTRGRRERIGAPATEGEPR
jgi:MerR family redox-sensitive transcriptional activator SoxR